MKKALFSILFLALAGGVFAQEDTPALGKNIIKLNVEGLLTDRYQMSFERVLGKYTSIQLTSGFYFDYLKQDNSNGEASNTEKTNGWLISPEFRVYLSEFTNDQTPEGVFVAIAGNYSTRKDEEHRTDAFNNSFTIETTENVGLGIAIGFQYITDFGVGFEAYVGPQFRYQFRDTEYFNEDFGFPGANSYTNTSTVEKLAWPIGGINVSYQF